MLSLPDAGDKINALDYQERADADSITPECSLWCRFARPGHTALVTPGHQPLVGLAFDRGREPIGRPSGCDGGGLSRCRVRRSRQLPCGGRGISLLFLCRESRLDIDAALVQGWGPVGLRDGQQRKNLHRSGPH
jgi:hypothetical protein